MRAPGFSKARLCSDARGTVPLHAPRHRTSSAHNTASNRCASIAALGDSLPTSSCAFRGTHWCAPDDFRFIIRPSQDFNRDVMNILPNASGSQLTKMIGAHPALCRAGMRPCPKKGLPMRNATIAKILSGGPKKPTGKLCSL